MYSRDFGEGIRSEGSLRDYMHTAPPPEQPKAEPAEQAAPESVQVFGHGHDGVMGGIKKLIRNVEIDDLILIAIGVLLLLDSDTDNDTLIILILLMLFF